MADWKKVFKGQALNIGFSVAPVAFDIANGKGVVKSVAAGAVDFAKWEIIGGLVGGQAMLGYAGLQVAGAITGAVMENGREKTEKIGRNISGNGSIGKGFRYDSDYSATMRQRSLEAMGGHQGITNNALGSEARRRASNIRY